MSGQLPPSYLIQDPYDDDAQRFMSAAAWYYGLRPVCFYTDPKGRYYGERQYPSLRSANVAAAVDVPTGGDRWRWIAEWASERFNIRGIVPYREDTVEVAAEILEHLDLDWNSPQTLRRFRDKHAMKSALQADGLRAPASWKFESVHDLPPDLPASFVLKPNDGYGNRSIGYFNRSATTMTEVAAHLDHPEHAAFLQPDQVWTIEEFIDGPEYHVDGQVRPDGTVTVLAIFRYQRDISNGYRGVYRGEWTLRSDHEQFAPLASYAADVITSLGLRGCPFHMEVIVDADGPCVIDLGARLPSDGGGYQLSCLHPERPDVYAVAIHDYLGHNDFATEPIDWSAYDHRQEVAVYGISSEAGYISEISGVHEIEHDPNFLRWILRPKVGDKVTPTTELRGTPYIANLRNPDGATPPDEIIDRTHNTIRWTTTSTITPRAAVSRTRSLVERAGWELNRLAERWSIGGRRVQQLTTPPTAR